MGIEFREPTLSIAPNCHAVVKKGMVFNVNIGLSGLVNKDSEDQKGKNVALFIGDTVVVPDPKSENTSCINLTPSKKKIKNIAVFLKDDDSEEMEQYQHWNICVDVLKTLTRCRRVSISTIISEKGEGTMYSICQ